MPPVATQGTASIAAGQPCITIFRMVSPPSFNAHSAVPLYVQAADYIAALITTGELEPGAQLPSERDLAAEWGIAYQTVRRAMRELRERGLIVSRVGKGTFVVEP